MSRTSRSCGAAALASFCLGGARLVGTWDVGRRDGGWVWRENRRRIHCGEVVLRRQIDGEGEGRVGWNEKDV